MKRVWYEAAPPLRAPQIKGPGKYPTAADGRRCL